MTVDESINLSFWVMAIGLVLFAIAGVGFLVEEHRFQRMLRDRGE
jgi:hypothetical protein